MLANFYTKHNHYTREEVEKLGAALEALKMEGNDNPAEGVSKTCIVEPVLWRDAKPILHDLEQFAHHINTELFGFNIYPFTNYDTVNVNTYTADFESEYGWHNDFILGQRIYDDKITVVVNISTEEYTGGEFQFYLNDEMTVPNESGTIIIFPSWTQHRVKPVTAGTRKSLSFWIKGPKFY